MGTPPGARRASGSWPRAARRARAAVAIGAVLVVALAGCARRAAKLPAAIPEVKGEPRTQYVMRYLDVAAGSGAEAEPGKVYVVHYTGWLRDGTKFDSSRDRGTPFRFEQGKRRVIPGWDAGFEGMRVGARRRLFIPYQLAYGVRGRGRIPPRAELIFDVELLGVEEAPPAADSAAARRP
jgi:peptidylprolyl isomerase